MTYRTNGAIGALLDEYEKAVLELQSIVAGLSYSQLITVVDPLTDDPDCHSIQTILTHIVRSGHCYVIEIRKWLGEEIDFAERKTLGSASDYAAALSDMFLANVRLFEKYPNLVLEEMDNGKKITVLWGQQYDVEQLFEHAIVHILRHRRQIERFLLKLNEMSGDR